MGYEANDSVWWEVEGLSPAGTWHGVYQGETEAEGRRLFVYAVEDTSATMERYQDFRLTRPGVDTTPEDWRGYAWDRKVWDVAARARARARRARDADQPAPAPARKSRRAAPAVS